MLASITAVATGAALAGAGATIAAVYAGRSLQLQLFGFSALLIGCMIGLAATLARQIRRVNRPADVAFDEGFQMGYDKGYFVGRRAGRPTVVELRPAGLDIAEGAR